MYELNDKDDPAAATSRWQSAGFRSSSPILPAAALLKAADDAGAQSPVLQCRRDRRSIARGGLPRQRHSYRADALDAGRCAGAVPRLEAMAQMVPGLGSHAEDKLYADALRRAAKRFGARIVQEKVFEDTGGARRTDSGVVQIQRQLPVFTQGAPAYDVLIAADESDVFAAYLPYRTWDARPVAGSAGLIPDQLGCLPRSMGSGSDAGAVHEAVLASNDRTRHAGLVGGAHDRRGASRTRSNDPKAMFDFLKSPDFALAAFKGQRLTLRDWNLQLRQPILLSDGRMVVSVSPQEGFQHQFSELDTLGIGSARKQMQARIRPMIRNADNVARQPARRRPLGIAACPGTHKQAASPPMCRTKRATRSA